MKNFSIFLLFLLVRFAESINDGENSYSEVESCSQDRCRLPYCFCSNQTIPGDFSARETPQFISININGPLDERIHKFIKKIFLNGKYVNPDGCPIGGTLFLKNHAETDYDLVKDLLQYENIEIALTSLTNECPTVDCRVKEKDDRTPFVSWRSHRFYKEIVEYRRLVEKRTGLRSSSIVGYRSPNYEVNNRQIHWKILRENRFLYDSTLITREWPAPDSLQQQTSPMTWPHTMDFAATYDCSQGCYTHSFPGLWTIPIHMYQDFEGRNCTTIGSSHCRVPRTAEEYFQYLKLNLNRHLQSNHAPFIMSFDNYWINEPYTEWRFDGLRMFIEKTLKHRRNDVFFVRMIDIINWMKEPASIKKMKSAYLSRIGSTSLCDEQQHRILSQIENTPDNIETNRNSSHNVTSPRALLILFDVVSEPLFRSNIVYYATFTFVLLVLCTLIYDRFFSS